MSERVERLMAELTEYFTITEGDRATDEAALVEATEKIAQIIGDNGMKPGDVISLRSGAIYTCEPAYFNDGVEGNANSGQLLCRNWLALESTREVISDAEGRQIMGGIDVPGVWDDQKRAIAGIDDRRAFLAELPELARQLRTLATKRRDPVVAKTARLAQKLAEIAETEVGGMRF